MQPWVQQRSAITSDWTLHERMSEWYRHVLLSRKQRYSNLESNRTENNKKGKHVLIAGAAIRHCWTFFEIPLTQPDGLQHSNQPIIKEFAAIRWRCSDVNDVFVRRPEHNTPIVKSGKPPGWAGGGGGEGVGYWKNLSPMAMIIMCLWSWCHDLGRVEIKQMHTIIMQVTLFGRCAIVKPKKGYCFRINTERTYFKSSIGSPTRPQIPLCDIKIDIYPANVCVTCLAELHSFTRFKSSKSDWPWLWPFMCNQGQTQWCTWTPHIWCPTPCTERYDLKIWVTLTLTFQCHPRSNQLWD